MYFKKKLKILASITFTVIFGSSYGQVLKTESDTVKTTKIVVFAETDYFEDSKSDIKNAIKINPLLLIFGDMPIYYERKLSEKFSVEVGIGITFRNYFRDLLFFDFDDTDIKIKTNISFRGGMRYFAASNGEAISGAYLAPEFAYLKYSKDVSKLDPQTGETTQSYLPEEIQYTDFKLIFGYQSLEWAEDFFFDLYIGIGVRKSAEQLVKREYDSQTNLYKNWIESDNKTKPLIPLGVKISYGF
ncbi:hypothetical protein JYU16_00505 [bacterium AH-315-M05]|nr:hypothetical protein [bacterium AH-315-M05]